MTLSSSKFRLSLCAFLFLGMTQMGCRQQAEVSAGNTSQQLLSTGETTRNDLIYMRELAAKSAGHQVSLDLADDVQYRFLRARVAAAGKTKEKYPQFFSMIESMRVRHLAQRQNPGGRTQLDTSPSNADHVLGGLLVHPDTHTFEATAYSTVEDGSDYSFVDVVVWSEDGTQQISDYGWGEAYDDGKKLWARATGPYNATTNQLPFVDSLSLVSKNGVESAPVFQSGNLVPTVFSGGMVEHPRDQNGDGIVAICLNRAGDVDCDYPLVNSWEVKMPLKGYVNEPQPVTKILKTSPKTYAKLSDTRTGGTRQLSSTVFVDKLSISADKRRVIWDIKQEEGVFPGQLFEPSELLNLFISVDVQMSRPGRPDVIAQSIFSSRPPTSSIPSSPNLPTIEKVALYYGCLAEGTQITLADGTTAKIEDISKGHQVRVDSKGLVQNVMSTSLGTEQIPMVRLRDDVGHEVLMTASHPVPTPDRGVLWAEELTAGQKVVTESGITSLVSVSREMYHGRIHNLRLDTSKAQDRRFERGSTMFANGFLVGDMAMQRAYEFKNQKDLAANVLSRLPTAWHVDYQSSVKQQKIASRR